MGLYPRQLDHARYRDASGWANDRLATRTGLPSRQRRGHGYYLIAALIWAAFWPISLWAQDADRFRIATFAAPLSRDGPGLLLRDILRAEDAQLAAIIAIIDATDPDVLVLTDFDYDATGAALSAFSGALAQPYDHRFSAMPNSGRQTGFDLDGDGRLGDARDALGYGRFLGDGGIAVLSRFPIAPEDVTDLSATLWRDIKGATLPMLDGQPFPSEEVHAMLPVSSRAHWIVPIDINGLEVSLLTLSATPPVFDGPEDFNGLRNRDELRLFEQVLDDPSSTIMRPILIGMINVDPIDGEGLGDGIAGVLARADLQDPKSRSAGGVVAADSSHLGDPAHDTADWSDDGPGNLRVSYVLPSANLTVRGSGVFWPAPDDPLAALLGADGQAAGPHRLVWVDITLP